MFQLIRAHTSLSLSLAALILAACVGGGMKVTALATAKQVTDKSELIGGPNAQGKVGDYLLQNDYVSVIIRGVSEGGVDGYGGTIIDMDRSRFPGEPGNDRLGAVIPIFNGTRTVRPQRVFVLDDGSSTGTAIIRAEGEDAPYPGISPVQHAVAAGEESSLERNRPIGMLVKTDYILRPGAKYVEVQTTFMNRASSVRSITVGDVIDYGSSTPFLSGAGGFALPATDAQTRTVIFEGDDVSYGYHGGMRVFRDQIDDRSAPDPISHVLAYPFAGRLGLFADHDAIGTYVEPDTDRGLPKLDVPGGGSASFTRYILVGDGDSSEILESIHHINGVEPSYLTGRVTTTVETDEGELEEQALAGADVAILQDGRPVAHLRTNQKGDFRGAVAPGIYKVVANAPGYPGYPYAATDIPAETEVEVEDMNLPRGGQLRVFLRDVSPNVDAEGEFLDTFVNREMPGRIAWERVGSDPSPLTYTAEDGAVSLPFRPLTPYDQVVTAGPDGAASLVLAPGEYVLRAYAGPNYSMAEVTLQVEPGRNDAVMELSQVVRPENTVLAEFGARTHRSGTSESEEDIILRALANGVSLLVASDTGTRTDLLAALRNLDHAYATAQDGNLPVSSRIAVATGEQVATPGYGRFSAWPVTEPSNPLGAVQTLAGENSVLPGDLVDALTKALSPRVTNALTEEGLTGEALVQIDQPFGAPDRPADRLRSYFEAVDPEIDWTATSDAITHGPNHVNIERAGLPSEKLWIEGENRWTALNILYAADSTSFALSLNAWFALLNLGHYPAEPPEQMPRIVATGSGEAEELRGLAAGHPRNYIHSDISFAAFRDSDEPNIRHAELGKVNEALRKQRNVVSNAPWLRVSVRNPNEDVAGMGQILRIDPLDEVEVSIQVDTPCWAPVDEWAVYANAFIEEPEWADGQLQNPVTAATTIALNPVAMNARTGEEDAAACRSDGTGYGRWVTESTYTFQNIEADQWIVPVVSGSSFVPDLQGMRPLAIGNPLFINTKGGTFKAPCPGADCPNVDKTRLGFR